MAAQDGRSPVIARLMRDHLQHDFAAGVSGLDLLMGFARFGQRKSLRYQRHYFVRLD
jgi:hypothetical protein